MNWNSLDWLDNAIAYHNSQSDAWKNQSPGSICRDIVLSLFMQEGSNTADWVASRINDVFLAEDVFAAGPRNAGWTSRYVEPSCTRRIRDRCDRDRGPAGDTEEGV